MKYNILLNQKAFVDNNLVGVIDIVDFALFTFIYDFFNCDLDDKITFKKNGIEYTEIRFALVDEHMPILGINSKRTFINRMNRLISVGLIERYEGNVAENRCAFAKGRNWHKFTFDRPTKKDSQGCEKDFVGGMKNASHNNTNKDIIGINDNKEKDTDKSVCKKNLSRFDFKSALLGLGISEDIVNDWLLVRKNKRATNTQTAFNNIVKQIELSGLSAQECITMAVEHSWSGFRADWTPQSKSKLQSTKQDIKPSAIKRPVDGKNQDGTFNKNGFRYYHSIRDNIDYSIPLNAPPMPNFECEFDCVNQRWYNPNETTGTYGELW